MPRIRGKESLLRAAMAGSIVSRSAALTVGASQAASRARWARYPRSGRYPNLRWAGCRWSSLNSAYVVRNLSNILFLKKKVDFQATRPILPLCQKMFELLGRSSIVTLEP